MKRAGHCFGRGTAAYIQKVGGSSTTSLNHVHGCHRQTRTIYHTANISGKLDVIEMISGGFHFTGIFLKRIIHRFELWMAVERIGIKVNLCINRYEMVLFGLS